MPPRGPQTSGIKIQPVVIDDDYKAPEGYVLSELMSSRNEKGEIQFFAVLGKLLTPEEQEAQTAAEAEEIAKRRKAAEDARAAEVAAQHSENKTVGAGDVDTHENHDNAAAGEDRPTPQQ